MFIAIVGNNGFGVYQEDKRTQMLQGQRFLKDVVVKKYDSFWNAVNWAISAYNETQEDFDDAFYGNPSEVKLNWILFRNQIRKYNMKNR